MIEKSADRARMAYKNNKKMDRWFGKVNDNIDEIKMDMIFESLEEGNIPYNYKENMKLYRLYHSTVLSHNEIKLLRREGYRVYYKNGSHIIDIDRKKCTII